MQFRVPLPRYIKITLLQLEHGLRIEFDRWISNFEQADIAIFHNFEPPPAGGGHQFLRALWMIWDEMGLRVQNNRISPSSRACLFNSFNFDYKRLCRFRRAGCRMVHRVDGPIGVYRSSGLELDQRIFEMNRDLADRTIFQSEYSLNKHLEIGLKFAMPVVIRNATDRRIFYPSSNLGDDNTHLTRKIRIVASSWSDNPNKGASDLEQLERMLDFDRYEVVFVGRSPIKFERIRMIAPLPSIELAALLRDQDIYLTPSRHKACSNAVIEALACGLPVIYRYSGSNPEIVGEAGFGYDAVEEIPALLERLVEEYDARRARIRVPTMEEVAARYLQVMGWPT